MEHGLSVTSLLIVILAAFLTPIILHKLKLNMIPVVVLELKSCSSIKNDYNNLMWFSSLIINLKLPFLT